MNGPMIVALLELSLRFALHLAPVINRLEQEYRACYRQPQR